MQALMPPVDTADNKFHDGNPLTGELGTIVTSEHLNNEQDAIRDVQKELIAILAAAGKAPDSTAGQVLAALQLLFAAKNDTLGALSSLVGAANKLPYFTGPGAAALTDITTLARTLLGRSTVPDILTDLGLGEAAKQGVATNAQMATGTATNLLPSVAAVMSLFNKRTFSANDYIRIPDVPGGLIVQWGTVVSGSFGDTTWTYPTPFPNARLAAQGTFHRQGTSGTDYPTISFNNISDPTPKTLSNFMLRISGTGGSGYTAFVFAIGY